MFVYQSPPRMQLLLRFYYANILLSVLLSSFFDNLATGLEVKMSD